MSENTLLPLSHAQQGLWVTYKENSESTAYNTALPLQFTQAIKIEAVQQAVEQLMTYHPALRTCFSECDGVPYQQFVTKITDYWQCVDASQWDEKELTKQLFQASQQPFVLEQGVFRAILFEGVKEGAILMLCLHHIAGDAASFSIMGKQIMQLYAVYAEGQTVTLPPLTVDYADYVRWEAERLNSDKGKRMATYWRKQLAGEVPVLQLPTDHPRPAMQAFRGASLCFELSKDLTLGLKNLALSENKTLFSVLLSAWQVLLHRYSNQPDIWIAIPTSMPRTQAGFKDIVGYLVNPMIIRSQYAEDENVTFKQLLQQTGQQLFTGLYHQPYPFTLLIQQVKSALSR